MKNTLGRKDVKELVKVIVSAKDDKVVGFHMAGSEASEILQVCVSLVATPPHVSTAKHVCCRLQCCPVSVRRLPVLVVEVPAAASHLQCKDM